MVLHDEILVGDLSKFGIKNLTIECQPDKELEEMKAEWRHPNSVSQKPTYLPRMNFKKKPETEA